MAAVHRSRARHVQEAHEAIRPTDFERTPEDLGGRLDRAAVQLYGLIRDRALASQMPAARFDRVRLEIASEAGDIVLEASGSSLAFDGHLRVWDGDGDEGAGGGDPALAALETGTRVSAAPAPPERRATQPPPRYTEAGLVRRLAGHDAGGQFEETPAPQEGRKRSARIGAAAAQVALPVLQEPQCLGERRRAQRDAGQCHAVSGERRGDDRLHPHRGGGDPAGRRGSAGQPRALGSHASPGRAMR